jgi:hypothetical protein
VTFYSSRIKYWLAQKGTTSDAPPHGRRCPLYLARVLRLKAYATRRHVEAWLEFHFAWEKWLPDKWARVGACETGYGRRPGRWDWDSGVYVSFAGIIRGGYATFAHRLGLRSWDETRLELGRLPTPREQYRVAAALAAEYGFGAWGCGGA